MDLNAEQKRIATQKPNGHYLLKGVAGSGKTLVGLYRLHYLLNNYCFEKDDSILLVTYNKSLLHYMGSLFKRIREFQYGEYQSLFSDDSNTKIEMKTIDSLMFSYFYSYISENNLKYKIISKKLSYQYLNEGIAKLRKKYPDESILSQGNSNFLLNEINWIKDCLYLEEEYQEVERTGMGTTETGSVMRLKRNSNTRKAIFELMEFFDNRIKEENYVSYGEMRKIALQHAENSSKRKYTHILVDESQDLTRSQLLFLKSVYDVKDYSSIGFIADTAQIIYTQSWLSTGHSFASIGFNMMGRNNSLSKNFRTTTQISKAAYSLIKGCKEIEDDENYVKPSLIDKKGEYPVFKCCNTEKEQSQYVVDEIKKLQKDHLLKEIVILSRIKSQLDEISNTLKNNNINCSLTDSELSLEEDSVKLYSLHSIKGLEFKIVFIIGLNENAIPYYSSSDKNNKQTDEINERKLLYVGMTRATESLYLISSSKPSKFIGDLSHKYLRFDSEKKIKRFYNISIDDYYFSKKLVNIHGPEEKVRQWFIAELLTTYNYPKNCIDVEYPVKSFSSTGYVDIAIEINENETKIPLIFIETKQKGQNLDEAMNQLKDYMDHCRQCKYGVLTDGTFIKIIDNEFNEVNDIPVFKKIWSISNTVKQTFKNLKTGIIAELSYAPDEPDFIEVEYPNQAEKEEAFTKDKLATVPVFGSIQAGIPVNMNKELVENLFLPEKWCKGADHFALIVNGDSMTGADINEGDIVILREQQTANNTDIVAVALNDEGTLKKYSKMGDKALLFAENEKYEPIQLEGDQVNILGLAVGIIKRN